MNEYTVFHEQIDYMVLCNSEVQAFFPKSMKNRRESCKKTDRKLLRHAVISAGW